MPDYRPKGLAERIRHKCIVLYFPLNYSEIILAYPQEKVSGKIVHRKSQRGRFWDKKSCSGTESDSSSGEQQQRSSDSESESGTMSYPSSAVKQRPKTWHLVGEASESLDELLNNELDELADLLERKGVEGAREELLQQHISSGAYHHLFQNNPPSASKGFPSEHIELKPAPSHKGSQWLKSMKDFSSVFTSAFNSIDKYHDAPKPVTVSTDLRPSSVPSCDDGEITPTPLNSPLLGSLLELSRTFSSAFNEINKELEESESTVSDWADQDSETTASGMIFDKIGVVTIVA